MPPQRAKRNRRILRNWVLAITAFLVVGFAAVVASCNVHELSHAAIGSLTGWEVERINWCLPGGGSVVYGDIARWAGNAQGYAGGLGAAAFLLGIYRLLIARRDPPREGPLWWGAGLGIVALIGPQIFISVLEGVAGPGEDYTLAFNDTPWLFVLLVLLSAAFGALGHVRRWRSVNA